MKLTLSVRSFHVPATPGTCAWPPSVPFRSHFAGDARHLGGERPQLVDHPVDRLGERRDLALGVDRDLPAQVAVGDGGGHGGEAPDLSRQVRGHLVDVLGQPLPRTRDALDLGLPTEHALGADLAGDAGDLGRERAQLVDHRVDRVLELEDLPAGVDRDLLRQVATGDGGRDLRDVADLVGQVRGHEVDRVGQVPPRPGYACDLGLAAELALGPDLARDAGYLVGERRELVDHRVDGPLELEDLALDVDGDLLAQVAVGDGGRHLGDVADLVGQVAGHEVDVVGQVLPRPGDAGDIRLAAEDPFGADLARDAGDLGGERGQLVDHRVDGALQLEDLASRVDGDLLREVALGDGGRHLGDVADLVGQVRGHEVDVVGQVLPRPGDTRHLGLAAEDPLGADLACDAGDLGRERAQLVDHRVDRVLELEDLALDVDGDLLAQVAVGDGGRHLGDVADLVGEVRGHEVDRVGEVLPRSGDSADLRLAAELALGADLAGDAGHLGGEARELIDHRVHGRADPGELALDRPPLDLERHLLAQVALGYGDDHARDLGRRTNQVVDQPVDRFDRRAPPAADAVEPRSLGHPALAADDLGDADDLRLERRVARRQFVEGRLEPADLVLAAGGKPNLEVAGRRGPQCAASSLPSAGSPDRASRPEPFLGASRRVVAIPVGGLDSDPPLSLSDRRLRHVCPQILSLDPCGLHAARDESACGYPPRPVFKPD